MSVHSGRPSLAALAPSLVPSGRGSETAMSGILAAAAAVAALVAAPGSQAARIQFERAVIVARAHTSPAYSKAFMDTAWLAIEQLREATDGTYR